MALDDPIPDERLRLIFVCCHPAIAPEARAALTLRTVCGLTTAEIAHAFLLSEATLAQRLVRAKRKIAEAGIPFEVPDRSGWAERMDAVLSTLEVAYAQAHADAAMAGPHADFAREILHLTGLLAALLPDDAEVQSLAATLRLAEARRPARLGPDGSMTPLSDQNTSEWDAGLIAEGEAFLAKAAVLGRQLRQPPGPRTLQAAIHGAHTDRRSGRPTPWPAIVCLYDALLQLRDDPVVRTNRAAAIAETEGAETALALLDAAPAPDWLPWRAARAEMLSRLHKGAEAAHEYDSALALKPSPAEALFLRKQRAASVRS